MKYILKIAHTGSICHFYYEDCNNLLFNTTYNTYSQLNDLINYYYIGKSNIVNSIYGDSTNSFLGTRLYVNISIYKDDWG